MTGDGSFKSGDEWLFSTAIIRIDVLKPGKSRVVDDGAEAQVAASDIVDTVSISGTCLKCVPPTNITEFVLTTSALLSKYYRPDEGGRRGGGGGSDNLRILYTTPDEIGDEEIVFSPLRIVAKKPLRAVNDYIRSFVKDNPSGSFVPHWGGTAHDDNSIHDDIDVFVLTAVNKRPASPHRTAVNCTGQLIKFFNVEREKSGQSTMIFNHTSISVISTPFGLVNSALFCGHLSHGTISYIHRHESSEGSDPVVIFSNIKYLYGMEGGLAVINRSDGNNDNTLASIGLMAGKLKMDNGGGEFSIIIPWCQILMALSDEIPVRIDAQSKHQIRAVRHLSMMEKLNKVWSQFFYDSKYTNPGSVSHQTWNATLEMHAPPPPEKTTLMARDDFKKLVVFIFIKHKAANSWGSGILLDESRHGAKSVLTVVTNAHVIKGNPIEIKVFFQSGAVSNKVKVWNKPFEGIDMLFLKVFDPLNETKKCGIIPPQQEQQQQLIKPATLASMSSIIRGSKVTSVGYGLFLPQVAESSADNVANEASLAKSGTLLAANQLQPLVSEGIISSDLIIKSPGEMYNTDSGPDILVSSAHCWNGCSGGALFASESGKLVGLLTSNARVNQTNEILPTISFVIPANVIKHGWDVCKQFDRSHKHMNRLPTKSTGHPIGNVKSGSSILVNKDAVKGLLEAGSRVKDLWKLNETHRSMLAAKL